jgi:hypothetical protein
MPVESSPLIQGRLPRVCINSEGIGLLPTVVYRVKSTVPKTVIMRYTDRYISSSTGDDYPRVCITWNGFGCTYKREKSGEFGTAAARSK